MFRAEDEMVMQTQIGRWHGGPFGAHLTGDAKNDVGHWIRATSKSATIGIEVRVSSQAGGLPAISRWLSAAIPPVWVIVRMSASRQGCQRGYWARREKLRFVFDIGLHGVQAWIVCGASLYESGIPAGMRWMFWNRLPVVRCATTG